MNRGSTRRPSRLRDRLRALLAVGGVLGIGSVGTLATWTDQSTATTGTFSTGRVDMKLGSTAVDKNPAAFSTDFTLTDMKPGDTATTTLQVNNTGTVDFRYTIAGTATNNGPATDQLGSAITVRIYAGATCSGAVLNSTAKFSFTPTTGRLLAAGTEEMLCFRATLPSTADSDLQGQTTTGTFTFVATSS